MTRKRQHKATIRRKRRHKLSVHLLTLFLVTGLLLILIITGMFRGAWRYHFEDAVRPHINQYLTYIQEDIGVPPDLEAARRLAARLPVDVVITGPNTDWTSLSTPLFDSKMDIYHRHREGGRHIEVGEYDDHRFLVRIRVEDYTMVFLTEPFKQGRRGFIAMMVMVGLVLLVLIVAYRLIRRMLRPIELLDQGATRIGEGDLDHRVVVDRKDELGALATSFNRMADEIQHMLEAKRQLLLAISHELRSPLTRANVSVALLDDSQQKSDLHRDIAEMEQLIADLLEAERLNTRHASLNLEDVPIQDLIREMVSEDFHDDDFEVSLPNGNRFVRLDPARIRLMLRNLVGNALRHNRDHLGKVALSCEIKDGQVAFVVTDHGEGFEHDDIPRATEPFWRKDKARQRTTGGFGLGLYLSKKIAQAHSGSLKIESETGHWTRITATISTGL